MTAVQSSRQAKVLALLPAAVWYSVIWRFSAQTAAVSGDLSDRLLYRLMELWSPAFAASPEPIRAAAVELLSFFERKAAHMFLYFVLALLVCFAACFFSRRMRTRMSLTALACILLAGLDEYHQTMVPGRSGELRDVLVDLCGAGIALGFLALPYLARWGRRSFGVPLPALVPAALSLLYLCLALRSQEAHWAFALARWSAERFVPETAAMDPKELPEFLAALGPALRDVLFLAACGVTGVCAPMAGLLAGLRRRTVWGLGGTAVLAAAALSQFGTASLPLASGGLALLGVLGMGALWWISIALAPEW